MPISKFAQKLAHTLTEYLTKINRSKLNDKALYSYFWSKPQHGKAGLEQARTIARTFKLVFNEQYLKEALERPADDRYSTIIHEGFGIGNPSEMLSNDITDLDCQHIRAFICHDPPLYDANPENPGRMILETLKRELKITLEEILAQQALKGHLVVDETDEDDAPDYAILKKVRRPWAPSQAPDWLSEPQYAELKCIYDKSLEMEVALGDEVYRSIDLRYERRSPPSQASSPASNANSF